MLCLAVFASLSAGCGGPLDGDVVEPTETVEDAVRRHSRALFVSPEGSDRRGDGSRLRPWRTIAHGSSQLTRGRTLLVMPGTYRDSHIEVAQDRASIVGVGRVVVDTTMPAFVRPDGSAWTLHDKSLGIWRSTSVVPGEREPYPSGSFQAHGRWNKLVTYPCYGALASPTSNLVTAYPTCSDNAGCSDGGASCAYAGPGIHWDPVTKVMYVRLSPTPEMIDIDADWGRFDPNPNAVSMRITVDHPFVYLKYGHSGRTVQNLRLVHGRVLVGIGSSGDTLSRITLDGLGGRYGMRIHGQALHIDRANLTEHLPPWVAYDDVKHQYAVTMQSTAIALQPGAQAIEISSSRISRFHDAIIAVTQTGALQIWGNEFTDIQDDVVQLGTDAYDVEIHHNRMINVSTSVSVHGSGTPTPRPGTKYIHHNIIDTSQPKLTCRRIIDGTFHSAYCDARGYNHNRVFSSHSASTSAHVPRGDPRHYYNNTVVGAKPFSALGFEPTISATMPNLVFNNIFVQLAPQGQLHVASPNWHGHHPPALIMDGNVYFRPDGPEGPFSISGSQCDFESFRNTTCGVATPEPLDGSSRNWSIEARGLWLDPLLDQDYRPQAAAFQSMEPGVTAEDVANLRTTTRRGATTWPLHPLPELPGLDPSRRGAL